MMHFNDVLYSKKKINISEGETIFFDTKIGDGLDFHTNLISAYLVNYQEMRINEIIINCSKEVIMAGFLNFSIIDQPFLKDIPLSSLEVNMGIWQVSLKLLIPLTLRKYENFSAKIRHKDLVLLDDQYAMVMLKGGSRKEMLK